MDSTGSSLKIFAKILSGKGWAVMDEDLKQAIERLHHWQASFFEDVVVVVVKKFGEKTVWQGIVSVFGIKGHLQADKCYAYSSPIEGAPAVLRRTPSSYRFAGKG